METPEHAFHLSCVEEWSHSLASRQQGLTLLPERSDPMWTFSPIVSLQLDSVSYPRTHIVSTIIHRIVLRTKAYFLAQKTSFFHDKRVLFTFHLSPLLSPTSIFKSIFILTPCLEYYHLSSSI